MWTSVVFRSAIGLPRSADTEVGALINKPKQKVEKNKRQRPQKTFLICFPKWEKNTLKYWQLSEQAKECLQHNDPGNYLYCSMRGNQWQWIYLLFQKWSLWGDKTTLQHLFSDNATVGCRDERRGNGKSLDLKIPSSGQNATRSKKFLKLKIGFYHNLKHFHPWALSEHWASPSVCY